MPLQDAATTTVGDSPSADDGSEPHADRRLLIDGRLVSADRVFASVNPATGEVIGHTIYGLAGAVFSADQERALAVARRIRTGSFSINGGNYFAADSPFGGFKQSGVGREMGVAGLEEFLERKTFAVPVPGVA